MNFEQLFIQAKSAGIEALEVYQQENVGMSIRLFHGQVDKYVVSDTNGLAIRGLYQGNIGYCSIEQDDDAQIDFIIAEIKQNASIITMKETGFIYEGSKDYVQLPPQKSDFFNINSQKKIGLLKSLEEKIKSLDSRVTEVSHCSYDEKKIKTSIRNSFGLNLEKTEVYMMIYVSCVAKADGDVKSSGDYVLTTDFDSIDVEDLAKKVVEKAVSMLGATPVESKVYPIVFENEVMADLLEAFSPLFSGESVIKNTTILKDRIGEKLMSELVTIIDNPLSEDSFSRDSFDDEGVSCQAKTVIEKGVFKTFLHNLKTSKALGCLSTGNGFKPTLSSPIGVSPKNIYLEKGNLSKEALIQSLEEGLFITDLAGLHAGVDTINGNFSLQASGYLVKDGQIVRPVSLIVVAGNFLTMLNQVELIGNDFKFSYSQVGAPSIKVNGLMVSGK